MSDIKEIDIRFQFGEVDEDNAGHKGSITVSTGSGEANQVWAELQGRYGEDFDSKPLVVIPSEDAEGLKEYLENFEGFDDETKQKYAEVKEAFLKPSFKRVGDEVLITREDPLDEITPFLEGFTDVLDGSSSVEFKMCHALTPEQVHAQKPNVLLGAFKGTKGSLNIKLSKDLIERAFDMGTQFAPVPEPELAKTMINFFKKYTLNLETYGVDSLPEKLREVLQHPMLEKISFFNEEILEGAKQNVLPILQQAEKFSTVSGPIRIYFVIKDTVAVKAEAYFPNWFDSVTNMLSS